MCTAQNRGSISWNFSNGRFFFSFAEWDDVSSRWVSLLNLSFSNILISDLFIYYLRDIFVFCRIFLFSFFFCPCDGMIYRVAGVKVYVHSFSSFKIWFFFIRFKMREKDAAVDAAIVGEMKMDWRNALEALRNEKNDRECQNVKGLNSIPFTKQCITIKNVSNL